MKATNNTANVPATTTNAPEANAITTAPKTATSGLVARLQKQREATAVLQKTASILNLFEINAWSKKYNPEGQAVLPVRAISAKFVPKYHDEGKCRGYYTSFLTHDGEIFAGYSNAAVRFFEEILDMCGQSLTDFSKLAFDSPLIVGITQETFDAPVLGANGEAKTESRKTYSFALLGGEVTKIMTIGSGAINGIADAIITE